MMNYLLIKDVIQVNHGLLEGKVLQIQLVNVASFGANPHQVLVERTAQRGDFLEFTVKR